MIRFDTSTEEAAIISKIAERAVSTAALHGVAYTRQDAEMDLTACHLNGCPLRLDDLLEAPTGGFGHDVFGIRRFINRRTGKLRGCFQPRYSAPQSNPSP